MREGSKARYTYLGGPVGQTVIVPERDAYATIGRNAAHGFQVDGWLIEDRDGKNLFIVVVHTMGVWAVYEFGGE